MLLRAGVENYQAGEALMLYVTRPGKNMRQRSAKWQQASRPIALLYALPRPPYRAAAAVTSRLCPFSLEAAQSSSMHTELCCKACFCGGVKRNCASLQMASCSGATSAATLRLPTPSWRPA